MILSHDEGWNIPASHPFYPPLPAIYRNVKRHSVLFHASPAAVAEFLPEPLKASEDGLCVAGGIDVPFCTHYGAFQESFILMKCRYQSTYGFYCALVFHNGPAGIAAGREVYGTPKIFADVRVQHKERTFLTETCLNGVPVLQISSTSEEAAGPGSMPVLSPAWRLKIIPRADGPGPAVKQLIDCTKVSPDLVVHFEAKGRGTVSLGAAPVCDLTSLAPLRYGDAFYRECSYSEGYAEIVYDYLQKNTLG